MHRYNPKYPISKTLLVIIDESQLKLSRFLITIGYRRINKGFRVLDSWLSYGSGSPVLIDRIINTYPNYQSQIKKALVETEQVLAEEKEQRRQERERKIYELHRPCLLVITDETRPSQVSFYALFGHSLKKVRLPERLLDMDNLRAFKVVRWCIRNYLRRFNGSCPLWGPVTSFLYSRRPNENYSFDLNGQLIGEDHEMPSLLRAATIARVV